MNQTPIQNGTPFSAERTYEIIREFKRAGFVLIPDVLEKDETKALRDKTDELFDDPKTVENGYLRENHFIVWQPNELARIFCDLLVREPIFSLMEAIFGKGFQHCGNQVLRNDHTQAIDHWHVDDSLFYPLPDDVPRHDPRIDMPIMWLTVQIALTAIDSIECGPSQYVPGSHYSAEIHQKQTRRHLKGVDPFLCSAKRVTSTYTIPNVGIAGHPTGQGVIAIYFNSSTVPHGHFYAITPISSTEYLNIFLRMQIDVCLNCTMIYTPAPKHDIRGTVGK